LYGFGISNGSLERKKSTLPWRLSEIKSIVHLVLQKNSPHCYPSQPHLCVCRCRGALFKNLEPNLFRRQSKRVKVNGVDELVVGNLNHVDQGSDEVADLSGGIAIEVSF
jgi:hypothetical protein